MFGGFSRAAARGLTARPQQLSTLVMLASIAECRGSLSRAHTVPPPRAHWLVMRFMSPTQVTLP